MSPLAPIEREAPPEHVRHHAGDVAHGTARLTEPSFFAEGDPHALWRELRVACPLAWTEESNGPGFWSVTRYEDGVRVLRDWQTFGSDKGTTLEGNRWEDDPAGGSILGLMDPPRHTELRRALLPYFSAQRLSELEVDAQRYLRTLMDRCTELKEFDFGREIANCLPVYLSSRILGVSTRDWDELFSVIITTLSVDERERHLADCQLLGYLTDLADARRRRPGDDLLSAIVSRPIEGRVLSDEEAVLNFAHLLSASITTTRLALNGAVHALVEHPTAWRRLISHPDRLLLAADEIVRWVSPALVMLRTARKQIDFRDRRVRAGERVAVWLPSLNRDSEIFQQADRFLVDRNPNRHVGFGVGVHACIGQALARMELRVLLADLLRLWEHVEMTAMPTRLRSLVLQGIEALPVRVIPR